MSKVAIIGHSHTIAFLDAISDWRQFAKLDDWRPDGFPEAYRGWFSKNVDGAAFTFVAKPAFEEFSGTKTVLFAPAVNTWDLAQVRQVDGKATIEISPQLQNCLSQISDCDTIVSCLNGWEVVSLCLINSYPDYDFIPYEGAAYRPIDFQFILAAILELAMKIAVPLRVIKATKPGARILHLSPLPPLEDPTRAPYLEQFGDLIKKFGVTRSSLRLKWHHAFRDELRRLLMSAGILVVQEAPEAVSERGFLRDEFALSINHANEAYGALMARRVSQIVFG